ncbi:TRAP transporter substrate-binding protein [Rhizobium sp. L1K21]|uniref:TRAP transporter substrate-binding protein n=1 Tax=Rhizobium sp. L1K21 TaxID=2954933 RepID=UPI0020930C20|nr:TRAP transporter substrate-binding protein [Rhizobium sp. L1K21]MCO6185368.1 TRAP transporter substrate-binding protein [Rhizobium sp. L1K21]
MLNKMLKAALTGAAMLAMTGSAFAADVTLRLHQMLPPQATIPAKAIDPWIKKVQDESGGRIAIEHYPAMQLGGKPSDLVDQVKDGVVDLIWTVIGYTPGRFPKTEAFELPFMVTNPVASSMAFQEYYEKHLTDEFKDYHVIAVHVHGPGLIHMREAAITKMEDLNGKKLRGTSRVVNSMLTTLGASAIGMPVPAVPEALSKGVIDGTVIPWEVTPTVKVSELAPHHTQFSGGKALYTATFLFAMNKDTYDNLPDDLKKVIDDNTGMEVAKAFGQAMADGDAAGLAIAEKDNNEIVTLSEEETARWQEVADKVSQDWVKEMDDKGLDGTGLYKDAQDLVAKYTAM